MNKKLKLLFVSLLCIAATLLIVVLLWDSDIAVMNPKGMIGAKERDLIVLATWLMLIVVIPALFLALYVSWKYTEKNEKAKYNPEWDQSILAETIWWGVPCIIILVLGIITWKSSHELDPFKPIDTPTKPLKVQVVALLWKWLFIYPEQNIAVVNFLQVPENTPIHFEITSDGPMNSFWIPNLGSQIFAMAGMRTELHLIAEQKGDFRGFSANLSGKGFAGMTFITKSCSQEDFEQWVETAKQSNKYLDIPSYKDLSEPSEYDPVSYYTLKDPKLFDWVIMKYMMPMPNEVSMGEKQNNLQLIKPTQSHLDQENLCCLEN